MAILCCIPSIAAEAQSIQTLEQHGACDFDGFVEAVNAVQAIRKERLISAKRFAEMADEANTMVLDARGESDFAVLHVKGNKNLPFTSFGTKSLNELVPNKETRILIYCRNNLTNSAVRGFIPYIEKSAPGGLNIPTAVTLYSYGYRNVWELDEIVDPEETPITFVRQSRPQK